MLVWSESLKIVLKCTFSNSVALFLSDDETDCNGKEAELKRKKITTQVTSRKESHSLDVSDYSKNTVCPVSVRYDFSQFVPVIKRQFILGRYGDN